MRLISRWFDYRSITLRAVICSASRIIDLTNAVSQSLFIKLQNITRSIPINYFYITAVCKLSVVCISLFRIKSCRAQLFHNFAKLHSGLWCSIRYYYDPACLNWSVFLMSRWRNWTTFFKTSKMRFLDASWSISDGLHLTSIERDLESRVWHPRTILSFEKGGSCL